MEKSLLTLLKNPFLIFYVAIYFLFLTLLHKFEEFNITEPILLFLIVGIGFSTFAWFFSRNAKPLEYLVKQPAFESSFLVVYLLLVICYLTWGINIIESSISTEPFRSFIILVSKLLVFVIIPAFVYRWFWGYSISGLTISYGWQKHLNIALWMSLILLLFQLVFGQGLSIMRQSGLEVWELVVGIPFVYLLLFIEVGLVEEFFFRSLIQTRLSSIFHSEIAGIITTSLLFGLAHSPGLYFRTSKTLESIGSDPSLLMSIGYPIVMISITGFFLGIIWSRTRNLLILMIIHASGDLVPNLAGTLKNWLF